jgi:hypothetical protein
MADENTLTKIKSVVKAYLSTAMEDLESLILLGKLEIGN